MNLLMQKDTSEAHAEGQQQLKERSQQEQNTGKNNSNRALHGSPSQQSAGMALWNVN